MIMVVYAQFVLGHFSQSFAVENGLNSLGLSFGYSNEDVLLFLESRSIQQLHGYVDFLKVWDTIFPLVYTLMYTLWIMYFFRKSRYLIIIPCMHMLADWIENYIEVSMVNQYIDIGALNETLVAQGSFVTMTKWVLSMLTYGIIVFGVIRTLKYALSRHKA